MVTGATDISLFPVRARVFDDTIDGYFPLQNSLAQMMDRQGFAAARVQIRFAPIIDVPGLAHGAPVPLNIRSGRAGMIEKMDLVVTHSGGQVSGHAQWRWFGKENEHPEGKLDPMTRLAEPAFIHGIGLDRGDMKSRAFGSLAAASVRQALVALVRTSGSGSVDVTDALARLGWDAADVLLPPVRSGVIEDRPADRPAPETEPRPDTDCLLVRRGVAAGKDR